jgi:SAM-dependent methyltransferase
VTPEASLRGRLRATPPDRQDAQMVDSLREHFNEWYADMADTPQRDSLKQQHLGLPPDLESTSLLHFDGLLEIREWLALTPDKVLLDLACGRGGYALWFAATTGARVIGVDFSDVAIAQATQAAERRGLTDRVTFQVGELEAIGLPDASVDAVLCVDAVQFAGDPTRAATEIRRVLRPGGLAVLTGWESIVPGDERLPERIRQTDLGTQLPAGGLVDVSVADRPDWRVPERSMWEAARDVDPGGDAALKSLQEEAAAVLPTFDLMRRVLATCRAPG